MAPGPRWDHDSRGHGVGSAAGLLPDLQRLAERMAQPDWVAEEPDAHLLPHLGRTGAPPSRRDQREAVFALIGALAEPATYVRERSADGTAEYEVATGVL